MFESYSAFIGPDGTRQTSYTFRNSYKRSRVWTNYKTGIPKKEKQYEPYHHFHFLHGDNLQISMQKVVSLTWENRRDWSSGRQQQLQFLGHWFRGRSDLEKLSLEIFKANPTSMLLMANPTSIWWHSTIASKNKKGDVRYFKYEAVYTWSKCGKSKTFTPSN